MQQQTIHKPFKIVLGFENTARYQQKKLKIWEKQAKKAF